MRAASRCSASPTRWGWPALSSGLYPMARLSSAYAAAFGLGLSGGTVWAADVAALVVVTVATVVAVRRISDRRVVLGLATLWGLFASPYVYDYDLAMLSVAAAILSGPMLRRMTGQACLNLLACLVVGQCAGFAWWTLGGRGGASFDVLLPVALFVLWRLAAGEPADAALADAS